MAVFWPLFYQALAAIGLLALIYAFFRAFRPGEYTGLAVLLVLLVLAALAVVNPLWGIWIKPSGSWVLYSLLSAVGGFLLMAGAATLYELFRPPTVKSLGPEAMAFMLPAFPYVLTSMVALAIRWWIYR
jgi:hypothetical protein